MLGSRSIYHDGWKATTDHVSPLLADERLLEGSRDFDSDRWSLFRLDDDFSEAVDVADAHPDIVQDLEKRWWTEAERNQVLPIEDGVMTRAAAMERPMWPQPTHVRLRPEASPLADEAVPSLGAGALLVADVDVPLGGGEGVLCVMGDWTHGWVLLVLAGRPSFVVNLGGTEHRLDASEPLTPGRHRIGFQFHPDDTGAGPGVLLVDHRPVVQTHLPRGMATSGLQIGGGGLRLGHDSGFPVSEDYTPPFPWTGILHSVTFDAAPPSVLQRRAEFGDVLRTE
jgi:arylsulfatase